MTIMQMFQQQRAEDVQQRRDDLAAQEARYQQQRADDLKREKDARAEHVLTLAALQAQSQDAIKTLGDEVKRLAVRGPESARPSTIKLPSFDLEKDRSTFKQWKDRWQMHIKAHRIHLIPDVEERRERCLTELTAALSNETLKWIANKDFSDEDRVNPEVLVQAFEDHIRESTNPTVTVVELFTMKRHPHETADHLNARINEKLNEVDFSVITDIRDYFGMTATIIANDPALRKRMYLDKVDSYAKAHAAVKADEQATVHSRMVSSAGTASADANAMSAYKKGQSAQSQAAQPQRGGYQGSNLSRGSQFSRGGPRGFHQSRGGSSGQNSTQQYDRSSRDRGRGYPGRGHTRSQSMAERTPEACKYCGRPWHPRAECWAVDKLCRNCGKTGHISPVCRSEALQASAQHIGTDDITDQEYGYGSLGSVAVEGCDIFQAAANKRDHEIRAIMPLDKITVKLTPLNHNVVLNIEVIPDTGAMVTAIPATHATGLQLDHTEVVLRNAAGQKLVTLGVFEALIEYKGNATTDVVYVVDGLLHPLIGQGLMKSLGLLHPNFPHHLGPTCSATPTQQYGVIQLLGVGQVSFEPTPKRVRFGPPMGPCDTKMSQIVNGNRQKTFMSKKTSWLPEPTHISESECSDDEEEEEPHSKPTLDSVGVLGQASVLPTPKATKPRSEAAPGCDQTHPKRPIGPHHRVGFRSSHRNRMSGSKTSKGYRASRGDLTSSDSSARRRPAGVRRDLHLKSPLPSQSGPEASRSGAASSGEDQANSQDAKTSSMQGSPATRRPWSKRQEYAAHGGQ